MRSRFVVGNWKMHKDAASSRQLASDIVKGMHRTPVGVVVCPPFPYLSIVGEQLRGSAVALGAQNASAHKEGAYTGEVSPGMLLDVGCRYVIVGHSERRKGGETDEFINCKVNLALSLGLKTILCVGEHLEERLAHQTTQVLRTQLMAGVKGVATAALNHLLLAYEPTWAIGTGQIATPEQAQEAHTFLRQILREAYGEQIAQMVPILYGGSVRPENVRETLACPDVDGGLVGGASLQADSFLKIVQAADA
jgi:triosephosphate isomerase (TIM)